MPVKETRNYVTHRIQTENGQNIVMSLEYANVITGGSPLPMFTSCVEAEHLVQEKGNI